MTDLIKFLRTSTSSAYNKVAADRIEELERERDDLGRKLNTARYGQPDFAWSIHEEAMADLRAKLTKAMAALRGILKGDDMYPWRIAREALVELEGEDHD